MLRLREIFYEALVSTGRFPRWWILALTQAGALYLIGELSQPYLIFGPFAVCWLILAVFVMAPATVWLWLETAAYKLKRKNEISVKTFFEYCAAAGVITACSLVIFIAAKLVYHDWLFSALASSIISATAVLAILYVVLCGQRLNKALILAIDTWNKKISLAAIVAFVIILAHGASFALVHGWLKSFTNSRGFSVLGHSATIWILFSALFLLTALIAAFLNSFLVLLFLEIIARKKDPEEEKAVLGRLITSPANQLYKGG